MKNRLRITGYPIPDTILVLIVLTTIVTLVYGWTIGFPEGFPQRRETDLILLFTTPITLIYMFWYLVVNARIEKDDWKGKTDTEV